jgi:fructose 1,6-bisphosphate aldolase/phosphatase
LTKTSLSVIKADVGSLAGHHVVHPKQLSLTRELLEKAKRDGRIIDAYVFNCGDDINLVLTHGGGVDNREIHRLAWDTFKEVAALSRSMHLYAAGQDLLTDSFSGNVKGLGPGVAEMEIEERPSEPVIVFAADKTEPGAWNFPLYRIFADPLCTAGLIIDPNLHGGFDFDVLDVEEGSTVRLHTPPEVYDLLALIGTQHKYVIRSIYRHFDNLLAAVASTQRLSLIAGKYVGKDDPVAIVRVQHGLPAAGEALEPFAFPHLVAGWMRGSHVGPIMPVSLRDAKCTRFDGPPRVVSLGFQLCDGALIGPADMFDDPAYDETRRKASEIADYMRRHGPFMPHRLPPAEMEYTTMPQVLEKLKDRFVKS